MPKVYVGDIGTQITVLTKTNLTDATGTILKVKVSRPIDARSTFTAYMEWPAIVKGAPKEGVIEHIAKAGDFAAAGTYAIQAHVTFDDGGEFSGEAAKLTVSPLFE